VAILFITRAASGLKRDAGKAGNIRGQVKSGLSWVAAAAG
jgi:hypothetical protein